MTTLLRGQRASLIPTLICRALSALPLPVPLVMGEGGTHTGRVLRVRGWHDRNGRRLGDRLQLQEIDAEGVRTVLDERCVSTPEVYVPWYPNAIGGHGAVVPAPDAHRLQQAARELVGSRA